jgi:hypothetical protein
VTLAGRMAAELIDADWGGLAHRGARPAGATPVTRAWSGSPSST